MSLRASEGAVYLLRLSQAIRAALARSVVGSFEACQDDAHPGEVFPHRLIVHARENRDTRHMGKDMSEPSQDRHALS